MFKKNILPTPPTYSYIALLAGMLCSIKNLRFFKGSNQNYSNFEAAD